MIDLYFWTTPNGHKITIFLEETGIPYNIKPVNIGKGDQFEPEFLKISPNNSCGICAIQPFAAGRAWPLGNECARISMPGVTLSRSRMKSSPPLAAGRNRR